MYIHTHIYIHTCFMLSPKKKKKKKKEEGSNPRGVDQNLRGASHPDQGPRVRC